MNTSRFFTETEDAGASIRVEVRSLEAPLAGVLRTSRRKSPEAGAASADGEEKRASVAAPEFALALVSEQRGSQVVLRWNTRPRPELIPPAGARIQLVRDIGDGAFSLNGVVRSSDKTGLVVEPTGEPRRFERRSYLRVDADLPLRWRIVEEAEAEALRIEIQSSQAERRERAQAAKQRSGPVVPDLPEALTRRLDELESKLDQILEQLTGGAAKEPSSPGLRQVCETNVSGSGIRFTSHAVIDPGSLLEVDFQLPVGSPPINVHGLAEVVRAIPMGDDKGSEGWTICCRFLAIDESHRDGIVRFTFERQQGFHGRDEEVS